ncbi:MAG TPA: fused MFS/spermidine synthase, partial [Vicinamibacterales bacterium]|nr:fused MFS/spermidine synthase [Vicinamibacterales bacterium]
HQRSVIVPLLMAVALLATGIALVVWSMSSAPIAGTVEHEETSAFSKIRIRRDGDVRAMTFVRDNGQEAVQSRVNLKEPQTLLSPYAHGMFASYLYQPQPRRVLIVGLGGGAMVRFLTHHEPQVQIDAVEIDPVVVQLADKFFDVRSGGNVRVHTADAVKFVEATTERYDVILMDAFLRPSGDTDTTGVPTRLKTLEFLGRLKQILAPGGVIAFNVNEHASMADDIASVATAFGHAVVYRCPPSQNKVVVAVEGALATDDEVRARVTALDARFGGALSFAEILRNRD